MTSLMINKTTNIMKIHFMEFENKTILYLIWRNFSRKINFLEKLQRVTGATNFTISLKMLFLCLFVSFKGQSQMTKFDPDSAFATARKMAFDGKKAEAETSLNLILSKYPKYDEIRLFLATVYGWDKKYKLAGDEFKKLLNRDRSKKDYWVGYIKNELWADQPLKAIELANQALDYLPNNPTITILKATAEKNNNELGKALHTINNYLRQNPNHKEVLEFKNSMSNDLATNQITFKYSQDFFSQIYESMQYYTLQYGKSTKWGSIIGKYNLNKKFGEYGSQFEIDAYPGISKGLYSYVNIGYSNSPIFPSFRYGFQVYKSLPKSFEASVGFRSLKFGERYTNIFTGSVGKYIGNSFIFVVPYFIPSNEGLSKSVTMTYRKYRATANQYFSVSTGFGFSPEINRFGFDAAFQPIVGLKSQKLDISNTFKIKNNKNFISTELSVVHQESIFDPGKYFWITSLSVSATMGY